MAFDPSTVVQNINLEGLLRGQGLGTSGSWWTGADELGMSMVFPFPSEPRFRPPAKAFLSCGCSLFQGPLQTVAG